MADRVFEGRMVGAAQVLEKAVDEELERLENLHQDDLAAIRKNRIDSLKKMAAQKQDWISAGHGEYTEVATEKEFFDVTKKSKNVICHFYKDSTFRCEILDKHLKILAPKHLEARFVKLNVEKAPFLTERLKIRVIPTLGIVKDSVTKDFIIGFTELGNRDDFSTEMLEWRLARADVIDYAGDLLTPPDSKPKTSKLSVMLGQDRKKTIRGGGRGSDSDSD
ncbi:unnamed protein product [Notodromas monacha]|uniref:Thioredoxin domain-containing protein 9 n=1 Tax=Notodromas monacha TaxID=399045 RepID=A0A7R9BUW4_9CRUS|nr:unnamed protein product [Notodromas monacha]CAG0920833.1 unnamed protein product [Notodromas monacha]